MRKIQVTIAIYVLVVFIVSVFFMPMDRYIYSSSDDVSIKFEQHRPIFATGLIEMKPGGESVTPHNYVPNIPIYKLYISTITLVFLSIIAIQTLELLKQTRFFDKPKQYSLFDKD